MTQSWSRYSAAGWIIPDHRHGRSRYHRVISHLCAQTIRYNGQGAGLVSRETPRPGAHLLIGCEFPWLRPWAWGLALAYAGFGLVSETMIQLTFGFNQVRSVFMMTTLLFACHLIWRRASFINVPIFKNRSKSVSQELL